jgi:Ras family
MAGTNDVFVAVLGAPLAGKTQLRNRMFPPAGLPVAFSEEHVDHSTDGGFASRLSQRKFSEMDDFDGVSGRPIPSDLGGVDILAWEEDSSKSLDSNEQRLPVHGGGNIADRWGRGVSPVARVDAALLVFDLSRSETLEYVQERLEEFFEVRDQLIDEDEDEDGRFGDAPARSSDRQLFPLVLAGTKADLGLPSRDGAALPPRDVPTREVSEGEALAFAAEVGAFYMEVSPSTDQNVQKLTENLGLVARRKIPVHTWTRSRTMTKSAGKR